MNTWYGYVYETENLIERKFYVGMHSYPEFDSKYLGSGSRLLKAITEYGRESFVVKPLVFVSTIEDLNVFEQKLITQYREKYGKEFLYNVAPGGYHSGFAGQRRGPMSSETKRKISISNTGKRRTEDVKKQMSLSRIGVPFSREAKKRMGLAAKKRALREIKEGSRLGYWLGKKLTESHKISLSIARRGLRHSQETKDRMSASMKSRIGAKYLKPRRYPEINVLFDSELWIPDCAKSVTPVFIDS